MNPVFEYLHQAQLANTVTGYCTCMAGIMAMLYCWLVKPQPPRWFFAYFCILVTGIPTVWLHSDEGNRLAGATDVGSNVFLAWAILMAISGDFMKQPAANRFRIGLTVIDFAALFYIFYEALFLGDYRFTPINFGEFGHFRFGETALIINAWLVAGMFFAYRKQIPPAARPLIVTVFLMFVCGLILATANNGLIMYRIFPWHSIWHIVSAFALLTLWVFNHVRFTLLEEEAARAGK